MIPHDHRPGAMATITFAFIEAKPWIAATIIVALEALVIMLYLEKDKFGARSRRSTFDSREGKLYCENASKKLALS